MYPKADLQDFVNRTGNYLALVNPNHFTIFVANDKNEVTKCIINFIESLGECNNIVYNDDRIDFLINEEKWYYLTDYSEGVIES